MTYLEVLDYISAPHLGWALLLIATIVDAALPLFLGLFVRRYSHKYEPMSALGAPSSPVRKVYRDWLIFAGICFLVAAPQVYYAYEAASAVLAATLAICITVYGTGACLLAGIFPAGDGSRPGTPGEWIHGTASAAGFLALIASSLVLGILQFAAGEGWQAAVSIAGFAAAAVSFVLFVLSDKDRFIGTAVSWMGMWQRLAMVSAYIPLVCAAAVHV